MMHPFLVTIVALILCFGDANSTSRERVKYLPGFQGPLPFHLETGYVGVGENEDVQFFYYFVESESNPKDDPLILWLTGGSSCSSLSGLLYEIGPMEIVAVPYNGSFPNLKLRRYSWTQMASIIFLDSPVGAGFSYAKTARASHSIDLQYADQTYEFMRKWLDSHREFVSNPFYIGGDSYAGIPVPIITQLISNGNEDGHEPYINLKGYFLGNPSTFPEQDNYKIRFANGMGLISDKLYKSLLNSCHGEYRLEYINPDNQECLQHIEHYQKCIDGIEPPQILEPSCRNTDSIIKLPSQIRLNGQHQNFALYCQVDERYSPYYWANDDSVREALHVRKGSIKEWIRCNFENNFTRTVDNVIPYHQSLSRRGFRSLVYSGDHDMVIPHQSTQAWIEDLNYSVIDQWRSWKLNGEIVGYTQSYSNLMTFATVKGGGHTTPQDKPEECFAMFKRWISHQPL